MSPDSGIRSPSRANSRLAWRGTGLRSSPCVPRVGIRPGRGAGGGGGEGGGEGGGGGGGGSRGGSRGGCEGEGTAGQRGGATGDRHERQTGLEQADVLGR